MVKYDNILKAIEEYIEKCLKYETYKYTNANGETFNIEIAEIHKRTSFFKRLKEAKKTQPAESKWRVITNTPNGEEIGLEHWDNCRMFATKDGSTIAIQDNGTIISVCKNHDSKDNMAGLMQFAVDNGGDKLDTFDGNYGFYKHCGFEVMSWTPFSSYGQSMTGNREDAPYGWDSKIDNEEPIIFMGYTGNNENLSIDEAIKEKANIYKNNPPADTYEEAVDERERAFEN